MSAFSIQSRAAILFNTQKWYVGYSVDLFTHREIRYSSADFGANLNRRFNSYWQFGYTFQRSSESKFSFTPQLLFRTGDADNFLDYRNFRYFRPVTQNSNFRYFRLVACNLNFRYQKLIWGISNAGFHVGWQTKQMRIMLSNDVVDGRFFGTRYIGNLSFRYVFKGKE